MKQKCCKIVVFYHLGKKYLQSNRLKRAQHWLYLSLGLEHVTPSSKSFEAFSKMSKRLPVVKTIFETH